MPRLDPLAQLESELNQERNDALGRVGRKLQEALDETTALAVQLDRLPSGAERAETLERYREARKLAEEFRFYLVVHREALGLLLHDIVDEVYPVPRQIRF